MSVEESQSYDVDDLLFFFNDTATTEIYTLSLHDALPISTTRRSSANPGERARTVPAWSQTNECPSKTSSSCPPDRKSTRLNSSHANISYAVFCLKKKRNASAYAGCASLEHTTAITEYVIE